MAKTSSPPADGTKKRRQSSKFLSAVGAVVLLFLLGAVFSYSIIFENVERIINMGR